MRANAALHHSFSTPKMRIQVGFGKRGVAESFVYTKISFLFLCNLLTSFETVP